MSFIVDYIICECGDDFITEEELKKHLENDHETKYKNPAPEASDWGEEFSEKDPQVGIDNKTYIESNKNSLITDAPKSPSRYSQEGPQAKIDSKISLEPNIINVIRNASKSPLRFSQEETFPNVLDKGSSIITIKTEPNDQEQGSLITIKSETNLQMAINFDDFFANEMVLSHEEVIDNKDSSPIAIKLETPIDVEQVEDNDSYSTAQILRNLYSQQQSVKDGPMICALCLREFTNARSLAIHYARSHKENHSESKKLKTSVLKNRICEVCGKAFASIASLTYHQRIHTGERPYLCSYCNKGFTMPLLLQIHVRTHTGERPYKCPHCPKAFGNKAAINRHNRVHTGVKPYACPKCGKTFTQSNSMKLHVNTVHLKQPAPYKSKKRIQADLERDKTMHNYARTVKRSVFKEKKGYMSVYSTLT